MRFALLAGFACQLLVVNCLLAGAVPGVNIVGGGSFEDMTKIDFVGASGTVNDYKYYKQLGSPRTQAEIDAGANPVRPWQFHPDYDLGRWMPVYGAGLPGWDYDQQLGITMHNTPRSLWSDGSGWSQPVSNINISQDPLNASNHVLDGVAFRTWVGQIMKAPVNHVAGPARIDFDYYWNNWDTQPGGEEAASIFHVWVYGVTEEQLPTWQQRWGPHGQEGDFYHGPNGATNVWTSPDWSEWGWTGPGDTEPQITSLGNQWYHFSTEHPDRATFNIPVAYPYYYISIWQCVYAEASEYFWLYGGKPADTFAIGVDNITFQVAVPLGDVNQDGLVNALDISPFVSRLTGGTYQIEADVNQDGLVNALDISGFVACLTGGAACGGAGVAGGLVPEPAAWALLSAAALFLTRRR